MEKEAEMEGIAMEKEECKGSERSGRAEAKLSFLKKFFPDAITTPVGTCKLRRREVQAILSNVILVPDKGKQLICKLSYHHILLRKGKVKVHTHHQIF